MKQNPWTTRSLIIIHPKEKSRDSSNSIRLDDERQAKTGSNNDDNNLNNNSVYLGHSLLPDSR